ncbi:MAG: class F sortase [Marmoricola sp.]
MRFTKVGAAVASVLMTAGFIGIVNAPLSSAATSCTATRGYFTPARAVVSGGVGRVTVVGVGLTRTGQMAAPPKTNTGLHEFGWYDKGYPPGYGSGSVAMDAHVYFPNGTLRSNQGGLALGNNLLLHLFKGGTVTLYHSSGTRHVCFRVTSRTQYTPAGAQAQMHNVVYGHPGYEQLAIVVCSGTRLGSGTYTKRTIWYATAARP